MKQAEQERLRELLDKLKRNREKIPLDVLKTRYRTSYEKLVAEIKSETEKLVFQRATAFPEQIGKAEISVRDGDRIAGKLNQIYKEGGYSRKIGWAVFQRFSIEEVLKIAEELNRKFQTAINEIIQEGEEYDSEQCKTGSEPNRGSETGEETAFSSAFRES